MQLQRLASASQRARKAKSAADTNRSPATTSAFRPTRLNPASPLSSDSESALLARRRPPARPTRRPHPYLRFPTAIPSRSERISQQLSQPGLRDEGIPRILLAIGPADGWSPAARARRPPEPCRWAALTLPPRTWPAAVVAEQIYRAPLTNPGWPSLSLGPLAHGRCKCNANFVAVGRPSNPRN